eukprot:6156330-Prymnesium_polylepis.1
MRVGLRGRLIAGGSSSPLTHVPAEQKDERKAAAGGELQGKQHQRVEREEVGQPAKKGQVAHSEENGGRGDAKGHALSQRGCVAVVDGVLRQACEHAAAKDNLLANA